MIFKSLTLQTYKIILYNPDAKENPRLRDLEKQQELPLPIIMPLVLGVYIGFFTIMNDPHGTIATVFSMIPLTSPIVMLMRIPFGVPWWQIAISITILFGTFFFVVWFAAKIYRVGILMYGKKPTWRELYKWLKY